MISVARFRTELDRLFEEAVKLVAGQPRAGEWQPSLDVIETADRISILVEAPGVEVEDLEVSVEGGTVTFAGHKRLAPPERSVRFHRVEREQGRFERRVHLLHPVDTHQGAARLEEGLLVVEFPRVREKRERRRVVAVTDGEAS